MGETPRESAAGQGGVFSGFARSLVENNEEQKPDDHHRWGVGFTIPPYIGLNEPWEGILLELIAKKRGCFWRIWGCFCEQRGGLRNKKLN